MSATASQLHNHSEAL